MAKASSFRLTPAAERDLEGIWLYTNEHWGIEQANRYIDTLATAFTELATSPLTAPACDYIRIGYRRRVVERHVIYFRTTRYGIQIVRLLHQRMDTLRAL